MIEAIQRAVEPAIDYVRRLLARLRAAPNITRTDSTPIKNFRAAEIQQELPEQSVTPAPAPFELPPATIEPAHQIAAACPSRQSSKKKRQKTPDANTLAELLERIDDIFDTMKIPPIRGNWLPKKDINALHKIGIFARTDWMFEHYKDGSARIPHDIPLPTICSCHFIGSKFDTQDRVNPRFAFAIKEPRLPPNVEQFQGTAYRFGYAVQLQEDEHDNESGARMFWVWSWVVVATDGCIRFPSELRSDPSIIVHRRSHGARTDTIHQKAWRRPSLIRMSERPESDTEAWMSSAFRQLVVWWSDRSNQWSVGVRKDGKRATFSVPRENTAAYFANRQKVVTTSGATRPIIHYVEAHTRSNGSSVKAHVRGLSQFEWRGYRCSVTAPHLRGLLTNEFDVMPVEVPNAEAAANRVAYLDNVQLAERLADLEDVHANAHAKTAPATLPRHRAE